MTEPCPACGLKAWDADDLSPGDFVCTCGDEPDDDAGHGDDRPPEVVTGHAFAERGLL